MPRQSIPAATTVQIKDSGQTWNGSPELHFGHAVVRISKAIAPHETLSVELSLQPALNAGPATLPPFLEVEVLDPFGGVIAVNKNRIMLSTELFIADYLDLVNAKVGEFVNVGTLGPVSAGKSTEGCLLATAVSSEYQLLFYSGVMEGLSSMTSKTSIKTTADADHLFPLRYYDTIGWMNEPYSPELIEAFLDGIVPAGFPNTTMDALDDYLRSWTSEAILWRLKRAALWLGIDKSDPRWHHVVLPVPSNIHEKQQDRIGYTRVLEVCRRRELPATILVTGIQEMDPQDQQVVLEEIARSLGMDIRHVFAGYHYGLNTQKKQFAVDKQSLMRLHHIMNSGFLWKRRNPYPARTLGPQSAMTLMILLAISLSICMYAVCMRNRMHKQPVHHDHND